MNINDPFPNTPQPNQDKPVVQKEGTKFLEEQLRQEFLKRTFLVVEDHPNFGKFIISGILKQRGVEKNKEDSGVILITNYQDFVSVTDRLFADKIPSNLLVVLDLNFPNEKNGQVLDYGTETAEYIRKRVQSWNSEHPNEQIILEIIMNSDSIDNLEKAKSFGAVGFSSDKLGAVSAVRELLKKKLETRSS